MPEGVFVTGTGTGVGKSIVSAAIVAALAAAGHRVGAFKPAVSGLDEPDADWPFDHVLLASQTGWQQPEAVTPYTYGPAVSPHLAAEMLGSPIDRSLITARFNELADDVDAMVCEGVGGLLVPLSMSPRLTVLDLAVQFGLPAVVAATPGLGTISDTLLTVQRLRAESVEVSAVVLTPWPHAPDRMQRSNRETIAAIGEVEVHTLPRVTLDSLATAAADLPVERWIGSTDSGR